MTNKQNVVHVCVGRITLDWLQLGAWALVPLDVALHKIVFLFRRLLSTTAGKMDVGRVAELSSIMLQCSIFSDSEYSSVRFGVMSPLFVFLCHYP